MIRTISLALLAVIAGCQPQARRLLLLDLNLTDPVALGATAEPWSQAGYTVEYRRYYPHLTRQDLTRYRVVVLLGGREPEAVSDAIDQGDLALLTQWVPQGGVLVFGYGGDGEGFGDRWTMNRWLEAMGAGITIGDFPLRDSTRTGAAPGGALHHVESEAFPDGRAHVLIARDAAQMLARAGPAAYVQPVGQAPQPRPRATVVAADRIGDGLVVIASRHTLGILGPEYRSGGSATDVVSTTPVAVDRARRFLVSLARWTRRPAEWAQLPPARQGPRLSVINAPRPVRPRPPQPAPPIGPSVVRLPEPAAEGGPDRAGVGVGTPGWVGRQGLRLLRMRAPPRTSAGLDSLLGFLEAGAFNALWSPVTPATADSVVKLATLRPAARAGRFPLVDRLQQTSVSWFPGLDFRGVGITPLPDSAERGLSGDTLRAPCAFDARLWTEVLVPAFQSLGRLAAAQPALVAGITLDLDTPEGAYGPGAGFCDATYVVGITALGRDAAWTQRFAALPLMVRYDSLLRSGLLEAYYDALERQVAVRAAGLRAQVGRLRPDVLFALRTTAPPTDWFGLGLLRGLAAAESPVLLWTAEPRVGASLPVYRARGINVLHMMELDPQRLRPRDWARLEPLVFHTNDGFWMDLPFPAAPADSVARLIRRLAKQ